MDFLTSLKKVMKEPEAYFKSVQKEGFQKPLAIYIFLVIIAALFQALYFYILKDGNYLTTYLKIVLRDALSLFVLTGIFHGSLKLLKGQGKYRETFKAYVYGFVPSFVWSIPTWALLALVQGTLSNVALVALLSFFIGMVAIAVAFYSCYLTITGFSVFHSLSKGRAVIAFIVPLVIFFLLLMVLLILLLTTRYQLLTLGV